MLSEIWYKYFYSIWMLKMSKKKPIFLQFTIYKIFHWRNTASDNKTMFLMDFTEKYYNTDRNSFWQLKIMYTIDLLKNTRLFKLYDFNTAFLSLLTITWSTYILLFSSKGLPSAYLILTPREKHAPYILTHNMSRKNIEKAHGVDKVAPHEKDTIWRLSLILSDKTIVGTHFLSRIQWFKVRFMYLTRRISVEILKNIKTKLTALNLSKELTRISLCLACFLKETRFYLRLLFWFRD